MSRRTAYDEEIRIRNKFKGNPKLQRQFTEWRRKWRTAGPIKFAEEILRIDPNTGQPLQLSNDQKEFLEDLGLNKVRLAILVAGRGSGKTFVLAIYTIWRIFTYENWHVACMGGSSEQTDKIFGYIIGWIRNSDELQSYIERVLRPPQAEVETLANSGATFHACSGTSVRGPHTHDIIIDEQAAGEEAGGTKFIEAAMWDVSTSPDIHIIKSSTAHFVHGDFIKTWNDAEALGYKRYRWSIAKHTSGETDPYKIYQDINPNNWISNVPWILDRNIQILRRGRSNDHWLVEALGGISITSGLVFNPADINACICDRCEECHPYEEDYCPIVQYSLQIEGLNPQDIPLSTSEALKRYVKERVEGIDWGDVAPCTYSAIGRFRNLIFVLKSLEIVGMSDREKIDTADKVARDWNCDILRPDPREWSLNNVLAERGFAIHELFSLEGGQEKGTYLYTLKNFIERQKLIIPKAFEDLIRSLRNLSYDKEGKIRKQDDHSFDSLLYAVSYYGEFADQRAFWDVIRSSLPEGQKEKIERSGGEFEEPVDYFGEKRKKKEKEDKERNPDEDNPYKGVNLWGEGK